MIVEWLLSLVAGLWDFIGTLIPDWDLPPELTDPDGMLATIFALGTGAGAFVNWVFVAAVGAVPVGVWLIGILWHGFRQLASHLPLFGGNG